LVPFACDGCGISASEAAMFWAIWSSMSVMAFSWCGVGWGAAVWVVRCGVVRVVHWPPSRGQGSGGQVP
jgi:hypothetical protein